MSPCRDGREDYGYKEYAEERRHSERLARMLCEAMQNVEVAGRLNMISTDLHNWWEDHKERDRIRLQAEVEFSHDREATIAGLTGYQKALLGIKP